MTRLFLAALVAITSSMAQAQTKVPTTQSEIALGFAPLVKEAAPAVVNIYAKRIVQQRQNPFMNDPFFEEFFRGFGAPQQRVQNSLGSGVILTEDGIVVSNFHVVGMATEISVVLSDRREYSAKVLLGDQESDLAILQLDDAEGLPFLNLRDSDGVDVGELVLAIGNPFGVGQTVTSGIVSGLARSGTVTGNARGYFIQTDAAINPGNSGGALIDVNGDLIGINTSILTRSGGSNGIGFAIPANLVREFVSQAREGQSSFERPWAGMGGQPINADLADSLGLSEPVGLLISQMHALSPFAARGIKVGDVITHVDGQDVNSPAEMVFRMSVAGIGREARISYLRGDQKLDAMVPMILAPQDPPADELELDERAMLPGLILSRVNPAVIARIGLPLDAQGIVVVNPGRFGNRAGFQIGDILLEINGESVNHPTDVQALLAASGRQVSTLVQRGNQRIVVRFRV